MQLIVLNLKHIKWSRTLTMSVNYGRFYVHTVKLLRGMTFCGAADVGSIMMRVKRELNEQLFGECDTQQKRSWNAQRQKNTLTENKLLWF